MFERVYHIAQVSGVFSAVFIASPNPEILELCEQRGIAAIATSFDHPCGSSRVFEAARSVKEEWDIVVNLQGRTDCIRRDPQAEGREVPTRLRLLASRRP